MKRFATFALLGALAVFALAGCSGCSAVGSLTGDKPVLGQTVLDEKALAFAEEAFGFANAEASAAVHTGLLKAGSPTAIQVADGLATAHTALVGARCLYAAGDATNLAGRVEAAKCAVGAGATITGQLQAGQQALAAAMRLIPKPA